MPDLDGLINLIPIGDIAKKLGIDENVAKAAIAVAVPAIVGGIAANAKDKGGAQSLQNALNHHVDKPTDIDKIDTADGAKIVKNVFGSKTDDVVAAVATKADAKGGVDIGAIVQQVLPIIAPIVLAFLASQFASKKTEGSPAAPAAKGSDLGSLIGGLLSNPQTQDMVGGLLGGLLGGGRK